MSTLLYQYNAVFPQFPKVVLSLSPALSTRPVEESMSQESDMSHRDVSRVNLIFGVVSHESKMGDSSHELSHDS